MKRRQASKSSTTKIRTNGTRGLQHGISKDREVMAPANRLSTALGRFLSPVKTDRCGITPALFPNTGLTLGNATELGVEDRVARTFLHFIWSRRLISNWSA